MRLTNLFSLALLCVGLASALPPLKCDQWRCSPFMKMEVRPGTRLIYRYSASASAYLPGKKTPVTLNIQTTATLDFFSCRRTLKLSGTRISSRDGALRGSDKSFQSLVAALEKNVLYFRSNDGTVDGVCSKDVPWVSNFKRGLLSVFQQPRSPLRRNSQVHIQMIDIHGSCPAWITGRSLVTRNVRLTRKLDACRGRHRSFGGLQSEAYSAPSPVQNPGLGSTQWCDFRFASSRRLILQKATCSELLTFKAPLIDPLLPQGSARVKQELELKKKESFKCGLGCRNSDSLTSFRASGLEMELEETMQTLEAPKAITDALCRLAGPVRPENPELFARLTLYLRSAKQADWDKLVKAKPKKLCPQQQPEVVTGVLLEGLAEAGDSRSIRLLTARTGLSDAQKDRLLSSLAFARRPELLLPHLRPVFERFHRLPRASLAAAALVHRFCIGRGARCDRHKAVRPLLAPLERVLKTGCDRLPVSKGVLLFRVLGNMRVPQRMHRAITSCAERRSKVPVELRVAALQALRRSGCPSPRTALLRILSSEKYDSEIRVAAYHALLVCRDSRLATELKRKMIFLKAGHVSSYIASHMANLRANTDPDQTSLRHFLHDVGYSPRPQGGLSRHFQQSLFSLSNNLGVRANGALVWSEKSASPRSANARLTGQLFGNTVPLVEVRGRMENVHELRTRSRVPYVQRSSIKPPKASAQFGLRFFGHDLIANRMEVKASDLNFRSPARFLKKAIPDNFRWNCVFADFSTVFASGAGLPLRLAFVGSSSAGLETTKWERNKPKDFEAEGGIKPELALRSEMVAAFELPGMRFGGKAAGTAHTRTEWRAKIQVKDREFTLSITAPEKQEALNLRWTVLSLHMNKATPVAPLAASPAVRWRSKTRLGYRFALEVQNRPGTPQSLLNNRISVLAERRDSHKNYVLKLWDLRVISKREIGVRMDMEGSRTNRALEGVFKWERRGARLSLKGESREFDGAVGCKSSGGGAESCFVTGRNEKGNLVHLSWDYTWKRPTSVHKVVAKVGKLSLGRLEVRVTRESDGNTFSAKLQDLLRQPVELRGRLQRIRPNKLSVGEMEKVSLNFTSSFLICDVTSKVEKSPRKINAFLQTGYAQPGSPKASASVKLGWLRLTDKVFRDKFTFKSFSSQKPMLNIDMTFKSSIASATDFRTYLVLKSWLSNKPLTASTRFLLDRKDRNAQSLIFQTDYDLPKISAGEAALMCEWNRQHISFVTKLKHACRGREAVNWVMSVKRKADDQIDAFFTFSSALTPIGVESELRRPSNGGLTIRFALQPDLKVRLVAKPFYRTVLLEASNAGWMAKGKVLSSFPVALNCSFSENSRFQIEFKSSHYFQSSDVRVRHRLTSRSEQIYDFALTHSRRGKKCSGSLDFGVGAEGARNRIKASYTQDAAKNLHNSNMELLVGLASASLRNDYSYELSRRQQKLDGRTHVTSTFGGRKRKLMLQSNMNSLPEQFNSDLQFSSFLDDKPSFVNLKFNVKDKNLFSYAFTIAMDSSFPKARSAEFDYSHEIGKRALDVKATARYLKKSMQLSFGGKAKGRTEVTSSVGLDLGASKFKGDMSLVARRFTARLAQTYDGVEVRGADLKVSAAQPSFDMEVREDGAKPHKVFVAREGSMWRARLEVDRPRLTGKARVHAGTGYLGHRFYLSSAVDGAKGAPLLALDVKVKPDGEVKVDGDCSGVVPNGTPCEVTIDFQKNILIIGMEAGPVAFSLQNIPTDERFSFALKKIPVLIQAKREGDKVKIQTDIFGYGLRFRCQEKNWEKKMTITRAEVPVFRADMTQVGEGSKESFVPIIPQELAMSFLCAPPPSFRVLRTKVNASSSTELGEFAAEGNWNEAGTGEMKAQWRESKMTANWQKGAIPSGKLVVATGLMEGELEASAMAQSIRLRPRSRSLQTSVDLSSRFNPDAWNLNFNVSLNKPNSRFCGGRGRFERNCFSIPGFTWNTTGQIDVIEGGRYYDVKYVVYNARGRQFRQRSEETYRKLKGLYMKEIKRRQEFGSTVIDYAEKTRIDFSDAGQVTSVFHRLTTSRKMSLLPKSIEMYGHELALNASEGRFQMRGELPKKYLASEPGTNRVVNLRVQLVPLPSFRLRTGIARRVTGSVVRFDLTGASSGFSRPFNSTLGLKTSLAERPWMDCSLVVGCTRRRQVFVLRHTRSPRRGAKVTLVAKVDRSWSRAEQSIELSRGSRKVLSTRYSRANRDVSLDLTMFGKKHFQGGWKRLGAGYEVLAQSVTMKKPLSLRFLETSPKRAAMELRTGADRRPLVLEILRPRRTPSEFVLRRGEDRIASLKVRPFGRRLTADLRLGKDMSATSFLRRGYLPSFELKVRGPAKLDVSFNRTRRLTLLRATSGNLQLLSASVRRDDFSLVVGEMARLALNGSRLEAFWNGQQIARVICTRPAPQSISTVMFWRPQLLRLAVNEVAEAWDRQLPKICAATDREGQKLLGLLRRDLPEMPPFGDARTSFKEFGKVLQVPRVFKSADFVIQFAFSRAARSLRSFTRVSTQLACSPGAKIAILRLRPGIYSFGDRFTTLQTWPDRLAQRFGRLVNGFAQWTLQKMINDLQQMKVARPDLSRFMPSARSLRFAQAQINAGLKDLKAFTMLKSMKHLDKKLLVALQETTAKMARSAQKMNMERDMENAVRYIERKMEQIGPNRWRLQAIRLLRTMLSRVRASQLAASMLRSTAYRLNEAARSTIQMAVPRIEQLNWRHGRANILVHIPRRRIRLRRPALPLPPIDLRRAKPGYYRPKVATLYSNFVHTFDQRNYFLRRTCRRMPLSRYRDAKFGWEVTALRRGSSFNLQVRLGKKVFTFSRGGVGQAGSDRYAQARLWSQGSMQFLRSYNHGIELETRPSRSYVRMRLLSPQYFGKLEGLWGNNDELPNNDWAVPGTPYNSSKQRFLKIFAPMCF